MKASEFKKVNANKWVWYNGAMGLETALINDYIEETWEQAVQKMADRDGVSYEEVENNYDNWYYIVPVEEIEDEDLNNYLESIE